MKYLSICSGIEAATAAWHSLEWTPVGFAEIEPFPSAVLAHHYPDIPNFGDMTSYECWNPEKFNLLVGGTPCQAFSVAGLRNGLADYRGNLTLTFCELADYFNPEWVVWENVPGVLSSQDNAFGCLLAGLAGEVEALQPPGGRWKNAGYVSGPKRSVAWRILDAQYFGVAQRRRRVFVVASAGTHCASEVLFERESLRRDSAPSRKARESTARSAARCAESSSHWDGDYPHPTLNQSAKGSGGVGASNQELFSQRGAYLAPAATPPQPTFSAAFSAGNSSGSRSIGYVEEGTPPLRAGSSGTNQVPTAIIEQPFEVANRLTQRMHKGINSTVDEGQTPIVCHGTQDPCVSDIAFAQGRNNGGENVVFQPINIYGGNKRQDRPEGGFYVRMDEDTSKTLDAASGLNPTCSQGGTAVLQPIPFDTTQLTSPQNYSNPKEGDPCHPLASGAHAPAVVQPTYSVRTANTSANGHGIGEEIAHTLDRANGQAVAQPMAVRRLTPVECARLQGFPDDYLDIEFRGKPAADGNKYKALGNSMAVPVMNWIGRRINFLMQTPGDA